LVCIHKQGEALCYVSRYIHRVSPGSYALSVLESQLHSWIAPHV